MKPAISMLKNVFLWHTNMKKHIIFAIGTLKNVFLLHTKAQDYHLKYSTLLL